MIDFQCPTPADQRQLPKYGLEKSRHYDDTQLGRKFPFGSEADFPLQGCLVSVLSERTQLEWYDFRR